ncbi:MAG: hypothetical protein HY562_00225, partial [Ignavibacteriales bacterium]|nr:hypothetical protein [Ignavibacteriales bacterium]
MTLLRGQSSTPGSSDIWVTAYYAGWSQGWFNNGVLPAQQIDYSAVTHIIHFSLVPQSDGSLDSNSNSIRPNNAEELVSRAHEAGKKILICVGGWGTDARFRGATSPLNLSSFVDNLIGFMSRHGYDGIDVDWEVLEATDAPQYTLFIKLLRQRLDEITPRPLLTAAVIWQSSIFAALLDEFDQINLMTYDLSGAWPGWVTWHNAPITDGSFTFPSTGRPVPSAHGMVNVFRKAGIPLNKIGIGIDFYGYVWKGGDGTPTGGATDPRQSWTSSPQVQPNVPYFSIIQNYYQPEFYRWDSSALASYLSIDRSGSDDDRFVSFDNEVMCKEKIEFARSQGLGGVIIWELGGGQLPSAYTYRDRLLQSVKYTLLRTAEKPAASNIEYPINNCVGMQIHPASTWSASPVASWYHLQVSLDSAFSTIIIDRPWVLMSSYQLGTLSTNTTYYVRVKASNVSATANWSPVARFRTTVDTLLPPRWLFMAETGNSAELIIPAAANPKAGNLALKSGDLVGVFLKENGQVVCGGFQEWKDGEDLRMMAWADNPLTGRRDGFVEGDTLFFTIWNREKHREYEALATFRSGGPTYIDGGQFILSSLDGVARMMHHVALTKGSNMISSHIIPSDSSIESITSSFASKIILVQNNIGQVFWPDSGINTIGRWDPQHAYQIYMKDEGGLTLVGDELSPELFQLQMESGWNFVSYLRNSSMTPESALASISDAIHLIKDNEGRVFWPEININTIGSLMPGHAYKVHSRRSATLVYPPNRLESVPWKQDVATSNTFASEFRRVGHHYPPLPSTGYSATLLIQHNVLKEGDEIGVWTNEGDLVGRADAINGKAVVTIWGANEILQSFAHGAEEDAPLSLTHWSSSEDWEYTLTLTHIQDAVSRKSVELPLRYQSDAIWIASVKAIPRTFFLEQNYPNPFNASTTIA